MAFGYESSWLLTKAHWQFYLPLEMNLNCNLCFELPSVSLVVMRVSLKDFGLEFGS